MISKLFDLQGKVALITGSSRGLGLVMAEGLARVGVSAVLNARHEDTLKQAVNRLQSKNLTVHGYVFDVTNPDAVDQQISRMAQEVGPIDILVNNAGIQIRSPLENFSPNDWHKIIETNLTGVFVVSKRVAKDMIARKSGKIINICSIQSELGRPTITPYAAAKGGVKMLTRGMAAEWARYNIQVNGLGPGYFITDMTRPLVENEEFNAWLCARTPAKRWGNPEELIGSIIFLSSHASDYVNGHILYVDGGMLACV